MKIRDYLKDSSFFSELSNFTNVPFITKENADLLDVYLDLEIGHLEIFTSLEKVSVKMLANLIALDYNSKWEKKFTTLLDFVPSLKQVEITDYDYENNSKNNNKSDSLNKVSAFNNLDLLDDNSNETVTSITNERTDKSLKKTEKINSSEFIKQIMIYDQTFIKEIITDIKKSIALRIIL